MTTQSATSDSTLDYDAVVVGAGFGGLHMLHRLRSAGLRVRAYEAGDEVGGTWFWNRYPGARCDFESIDYSYSFDEDLQNEWTWSERYASQPEILRYLQHVADRFSLRPDITLSTRVSAAYYDDESHRWTVTTTPAGPAGVEETVTARLVVMAVGALSAPQLPDLPGLDQFAGRILQTSLWPDQEVDFRGKRVAVIGTGSSGAQVIPRIAEQADQLYVLQRTAGFVVPGYNRALSLEEQAEVKSDFPAYRQRAMDSFLGVHYDSAGDSAAAAAPDERTDAYQSRWDKGGVSIIASYPDLLVDSTANDTLAEFLRSKVSQIVKDPATAKRLTPQGFPVGSKRLVVETDYYATYNRANVELVDLRDEPIGGVSASGVRVGERELDIDVLVFATGFDALTGPLLSMDIKGSQGRPLADAWAAGPVSYLGISIAGFPNLFTIAGPGGPAIVSNVVRCTEDNVEWIGELAEHLRDKGLVEVKATPEAEKEWTAHVSEIADATLLTAGNSWYVGANIPGKPRVFMAYAGGMAEYHRHCIDIAERGYEGFELS